MFNKKTLLVKQSKLIKVPLDKFQIMDLGEFSRQPLSTQNMENIICEKDAIKAGYGFEALKLPDLKVSTEDVEVVFKSDAPQEILGLWNFTFYDDLIDKDQYYFFFIDQEKKLWFFNIHSEKNLFYGMLRFKEIPSAVHFVINNGVDLMFFSSKTDSTWAYGAAGVQEYKNVPPFKSATWFGPYLFLATAGINNKVYYSTERIVTWSNSNIHKLDIPEIRGGLTKLISIKDILYIFHEYGLIKATLYSSNEKIDVQTLYQSSSYIFPETVARNGDYVLFMNREGIYKIKGNTVTKLDFLLNDKIIHPTEDNTVAAAYDGKYFIACRYDFGDKIEEGVVNNAIIIFDPETGVTEITRGIDIRNLVTLQTPYLKRLCATFRGEKKHKIGQLCKDGKFFGENLPKSWQSGWTDFGYPDKDKLITSILVKGVTTGTLKIETENEVHEFKLNSKRIRTNMFGKNFKLSYSCEDGSTLDKCSLNVKVFM